MYQMPYLESESVSHSVKSDSGIPSIVAHQAPLFMAFSKQECCSRLPFPSPGPLPDPVIETEIPAEQADSLPSEPPGKPCLVYQLGNKWGSEIIELST